MLVTILQFGSNWWARFGHDPSDPHRYTRRAAYYNSTGIRTGRKIRRHWIVPGLVRFNGSGNFNPHFPSRSLGQTFVAADVDFLFGGNRLLLRHTMAHPVKPDWYLTVFSQEIHGRLDLTTEEWRSPRTKVIAASQLRQVQEAMLLMRPGDWIRTACGFWQLAHSTHSRTGVEFVLRGEPDRVA
jgi:hypothetical protein